MQRRERCIVCDSHLLDFGAPGDLRQFDCPRCGQFQISLTACAMLPSRLEENPKAGPRLSHAIRRRCDLEPWFTIDSANLDALIAEPLPDFLVQGTNLLAWLASRQREADGAGIALEAEAMPAIIGAPNEDVVLQHVQELGAQGLLTESFSASNPVPRLSLTGAGWRAANPLPTRGDTEMPDFDFFVSHASEDKADLVEKLVAELEKLGARVWYDANILRVGDSLRRAIDRGLARSRFGVVVFSPAFFAKEWPQRELDGLAALEIAGEHRILPVWHGLTQSEVAQYSATLADRVALPSSLGAAEVARRLFERLKT